MYLLKLEPFRECCETKQQSFEKVIKVNIFPTETGFSLTWQLPFSEVSKLSISYSNEYTKEEVKIDFFNNHAQKILRRNGYVLFKEVS